MTRDEYEQKYGAKPTTNQPIQMTRQQYQQKYGSTPQSSSGYRSDMSTGDYLMGTAKNILPSAGRTAMAMGSGILNMANPNIDQNTLAQTARLAYGGLQKLDPTKDKVISKGIADITPLKYVSMADKSRGMSTDYQPQAEAVGKFYGDRYGGVENIKKTLYEDPVGVGLDASVVLGGAGALTGSSKLAKLSKIVDPVRLAGKGAGAVGSRMAPKISKVLSKASEAYATSGLGNPMKVKDIQGITGKTVGQLMREYKLFNRSPSSVVDAIEKIDDVVGTKIKTAPKAQVLDILAKFDERIKALAKDATISETARGELEALMRRKSEFVKYIGDKSSTPLNIPAETVRTMKKAVGKDIPETKFSLDATQTAKSNAAKGTYNIFKDKVNELAGTKQLGKDESGLIRLKKIFENADARGQARQAISIKDIGFGGLGSILAGAPGAMAGIAMNKFWNSPMAIEALSNSLGGASNIFKKKFPRMKYGEDIYKMGKLNRVTNPRKSSQE